MHPFRTLLLAACCTLVLALAAPAQADTTTYYKYKSTDLNSLPVFKHELPSLAANNDTGYIVEKSDEGLLLAYMRVTCGRNMHRSEYTHSLTGKINGVRTFSYKPGTEEKIFSNETQYFWDGDKLAKQISRDASGPVSSWLIIPQGKNRIWTKYVDGEPTGLKYEVAPSASGLLETLVYEPAPNRRYVRTFNPETGLLVDSMNYSRGAFTGSQRFLYADDGRRTGLDSYDRNGVKYQSSTYDDFGRRIDEVYFGTFNERYTHAYDELGREIRTTVYRDDKHIFTCTFVLREGGSVERTDIHTPDGELVATYPNNRVRYLNPDASAQNDFKGTVLKKVKLY